MPLLVLLLLVLVFIAAALWWWQVRVPRVVPWRSTTHGGVAMQRADGLVLQHDDGRVVWATQGYAIYRSVDGSSFRRVARVRPPVGEAWGGYLRALRRRYGYQELVELVPLRGTPADAATRLVVLAGGAVHQLTIGSRRVRRTMRLRYFGRGRGRGLMAFGIDQAPDGALYFAEYVTESGPHPTGVWRSDDDGSSWTLAWEFEPDAVRHIHLAQVDPRDGALWIGTGDRDEHCYIGASHDGGTTFEWVGHGQQIHRTCAVVCFAECVLWATDADFEQNYVVRWQRDGKELELASELPDVAYYASRIDDHRALLGLAQDHAAVWVTDDRGRAVPWLHWPVSPSPPPRGPSGGVRLARGSNVTGPHVHVNPLRTIPHEAVILRIAREAVPVP